MKNIVVRVPNQAALIDLLDQISTKIMFLLVKYENRRCFRDANVAIDILM